MVHATDAHWGDDRVNHSGSKYERSLARTIAMKPHALKFERGLLGLSRIRLYWSDRVHAGGDHSAVDRGKGSNVVLRADLPQSDLVEARG